MMRRSIITPKDLECMLCDETADPKALPLSLLEEITDGFSDKQQIGSGGFAVVYKGMLENRTVAVKMMSNTYMYEKEFHREVECLMMVKHKNVVRFLGYCADTQGSMEKYDGRFVMADVQQRLLCFEYLPKGSLREYITDTSRGLQWNDRFHIIKGICQGLHYLHRKNIVHLDLKPASILLDDNWVAKIADFGLSRCFDEMQSRAFTAIIGGTLGYLPPEFGNGEITYQFDIYSLGIIIIEILTGKKGYHAVDKVVESWSNTLEKSQSEIHLKQVRVCAEIGIECTDFNPAKRPDTQYIINRLDQRESMYRCAETGVITSQQGSEKRALDVPNIMNSPENSSKAAPPNDGANNDPISMKDLNFDFDAEKKSEPVITAADISSMPPAYASSYIDHPLVMERDAEAFQVDNPYAPMGDDVGPPIPEFEELNFEDRNVGHVMDASLGDTDFEHLLIVKNEDLEELRELGSGNYVTMYHGKWRGNDVAIKCIEISSFTGPSSEQERQEQDFWREAEILSTLHHPNVVAFYGVVKDGPGGTLAILTEFTVNGSLRHVLQGKDK